MRLLGGIALLSFALIAGCGGTTKGPPPGGAEEVEVVDFGFTPATLDVSVGTTVTWTNTGNAPHTVTFSEGDVDSGTMGNGATFDRTFDSAGTFAYVCTIHPTMSGTVTVSP